MKIGNYNIVIVCANELEEGLYGDIYTDLEECVANHPKDNIIFGYYCSSLNESEETAESPDWFYSLDEAIDWANEN